MRLIDADALREDFKSRLAECNEWIEKAKDKETKIRASAVKAFIGEAIMTIDNAPTFEERPQGKWEEDWQEDLDFMSRKGWKCPFCKWRTTYGESNFCMNCGADLRGGKASD